MWLEDKRGTVPNLEVEIDMVDRTPIFIRPYHVKEVDKQILDKVMKRLCHLGMLQKCFSAYSSPVVLISRKFMKEKDVCLTLDIYILD